MFNIRSIALTGAMSLAACLLNSGCASRGQHCDACQCAPGPGACPCGQPCYNGQPGCACGCSGGDAAGAVASQPGVVMNAPEGTVVYQGQPANCAACAQGMNYSNTTVPFGSQGTTYQFGNPVGEPGVPVQPSHPPDLIPMSQQPNSTGVLPALPPSPRLP